VGFDQLSAADVAQAFGVTVEAARRAKCREYGEPFRIVHEDAETRRRLTLALEAEGFGVTAGDRFDLVGPPGDESRAIRLATDLYRRARGRVVTVGFGDRLRDATLLQHVDLPIAPSGLWTSPTRARLGKACRTSEATRQVRQALEDHLQAAVPPPSLAM